MVCIKDFDGVIGGKMKHYTIGDTIPEAEAKELGLSRKPELAKKKGKK